MYRCAAASQAQREKASHANGGSRCTAMGSVAVIMHLYATHPAARAGRCSLAVTREQPAMRKSKHEEYQSVLISPQCGEPFQWASLY